MKIDENSVRAQSLNAYNQWKDKWREHAKIHRENFPKMKSFNDFQNHGVGRAALLVANGASLEEEIEVIKEKQGNVDIWACDKSLGALLDNGIIPDFCIVCDAVVNFEKYMEKWKDQLKDTILFINPCANPKWSLNGNWKDVYFFVNEDVLNSEIEFCNLSGCPNTIAAGTNVSNAMVILVTQSNNSGRRNAFGYDKILLIGYDYSWEASGSYYAFSQDGGGKHNYMRHIWLVNNRGNLAFTSSNLLFSARWLEKYVATFNLPIVQCSKSTILSLRKRGDLSSQMDYSYRPGDREKVRKMIEDKAKIERALQMVTSQILQIGREHFRAAEATL